jgi:uroporphyrin-III C-methyltransferase
VPPTTQRYNVGKRCGAKKITQAEINFLMTSLTAAGLTVVRLKSGDPLIFGRGGEELEALRKANVECEMVPGITAALGAAAAAKVPLTHRNISHAVVFLIGHTADGKDHVDWSALVSTGATLVIYMPGDFSQLALRLIRAGFSFETPCAVVSAATSPGQHVKLTTLHDLRDVAPITAPALVIVGDVVGLARPNQAAMPALEAMVSEARLFAANEEIL